MFGRTSIHWQWEKLVSGRLCPMGVTRNWCSFWQTLTDTSGLFGGSITDCKTRSSDVFSGVKLFPADMTMRVKKNPTTKLKSLRENIIYVLVSWSNECHVLQRASWSDKVWGRLVSWDKRALWDWVHDALKVTSAHRARSHFQNISESHLPLLFGTVLE